MNPKAPGRPQGADWDSTAYSSEQATRRDRPTVAVCATSHTAPLMLPLTAAGRRALHTRPSGQITWIWLNRPWFQGMSKARVGSSADEMPAIRPAQVQLREFSNWGEDRE